MIFSCDYCYAVFDTNYWSWCRLGNENDDTFCTLCSQCASDIIKDE